MFGNTRSVALTTQVEAFLEQGARLNAMGDGVRMALHMATEMNAEAIRLLLEHGTRAVSSTNRTVAQ